MARRATAPLPPAPLGEPPAPPVPSLPFGSFSSRVGKLKQRAAQPHISARPLVGALQRSPAARKAAVREEVEQRAKATQAQAKPEPGVVASAAQGAGEAAAAGVTQRARETRKLKQETAKKAADEAAKQQPKPQPTAAPPTRVLPQMPQNAPGSPAGRAKAQAGTKTPPRPRKAHARPVSSPQATPAPTTPPKITTPAGNPLDSHDIIDRFFEQGPGSERVKQGAATRHVKARKRKEEQAIQDAVDQGAMTPEQGERMLAGIDQEPLTPEEEAQRRAQFPEQSRARAQGHQERMEDLRAQLDALRNPQPRQPGPPRASDKDTGALRSDARAQIAAWERIADNPELSDEARQDARRRAEQLRRSVLGEQP